MRSFSIRDLAKRDVDSVVEIHQQEVIATLKTLTAKLYRRNPGEWQKSGYASADAATAALFKVLPYWQMPPQKTLAGQTCLLSEAGQQAYIGDRVKAMMDGLLIMNMAAFNHRTEFYLLSANWMRRSFITLRAISNMSHGKSLPSAAQMAHCCSLPSHSATTA